MQNEGIGDHFGEGCCGEADHAVESRLGWLAPFQGGGSAARIAEAAQKLAQPLLHARAIVSIGAGTGPRIGVQ
jgi:hypothetical protein